MCCSGNSSRQWDFYHIISGHVKCAGEKRLHVLMPCSNMNLFLEHVQGNVLALSLLWCWLSANRNSGMFYT